MAEPKNKYLHQHLTIVQRAVNLDLQIYTWMTCSRHFIPSLSLNEAALSFQKFNNVEESEISLYKIIKTYTRMQKEMYEEQKSKPHD